MNPDIPQEVRIVNAIAEQLFDVWPVSIVMIDLEDRIWRMNKQMSDELQQDADIIGKPVVDMLEVVQDRENVLPRYLQDLHEGRQSIIHLSSNCFMLEPKRHISFLIQGALMGIYEENRLVRIVLYYRNVLEESTRKHLLNIALSRTQIFQWSYDMERNLMIIDPRYFEYLGIPTRDYTLTPEEFAYLMHPDDRQSVFDALTLQLDGSLYEAPVEYRLRRDDGSWAILPSVLSCWELSVCLMTRSKRMPVPRWYPTSSFSKSGIARWTSCRNGPRPDRRRTGLPSTGILSTTRKWCWADRSR